MFKSLLCVIFVSKDSVCFHFCFFWLTLSSNVRMFVCLFVYSKCSNRILSWLSILKRISLLRYLYLVELQLSFISTHSISCSFVSVSVFGYSTSDYSVMHFFSLLFGYLHWHFLCGFSTKKRMCVSVNFGFTGPKKKDGMLYYSVSHWR